MVNENVMDCHKFDTLVECANANELANRELLDRWYKRDDNNIPPKHVLQVLWQLLCELAMIHLFNIYFRY